MTKSWNTALGHLLHHSQKTMRKARSSRGWLLTLIAALVGVVLGVMAIILDGALRGSFGVASIVFLVTAGYCGMSVAWDALDDPPIDFEAPSPEPPVPQSQITLVYDPGAPPGVGVKNDADTETRHSRE